MTKPAGFIATSLAIIGLLLFIAVSFVAMPLLALLVGMGFGWVLELCTGDYVVQAFNALGFRGVSNGDLPKVFGLIAMVYTILKFEQISQSKRKGDD